MDWDLKEPEFITQARLMEASPEFVYAQLRYYGEKVERYCGKEGLEKSLLTRRNRLIDLALARYGYENSVIIELYRRSGIIVEPTVRLITAEDQEANYNLAIQVACLSNRHIGSDFKYEYGKDPRAFIDDFTIDTLMTSHNPRGQFAILTNPSVPISLLTSLYKKTECFAQIDESEWLHFVRISACNPIFKVHIDEEDVGRLYDAIFTFLGSAPRTENSLPTVRMLLDALNPEHCRLRSSESAAIIDRWRNPDVSDKNKKWPTGVAGSIAALYSDEKLQQRKYWRFLSKPDEKDWVSRSAYYGSAKLLERDFDKIEKFPFLPGTLKNVNVYLNPKTRRKLEEWLSDTGILDEQFLEYIYRCEQLASSRRWFDPHPITETGRRKLKIYHQEANDPYWLSDRMMHTLDGFRDELDTLKHNLRQLYIWAFFMIAVYWVYSVFKHIF
jgi:hypothetical protein